MKESSANNFQRANRFWNIKARTERLMWRVQFLMVQWCQGLGCRPEWVLIAKGTSIVTKWPLGHYVKHSVGGHFLCSSATGSSSATPPLVLPTPAKAGKAAVGVRRGQDWVGMGRTGGCWGGGRRWMPDTIFSKPPCLFLFLGLAPTTELVQVCRDPCRGRGLEWIKRKPFPFPCWSLLILLLCWIQCMCFWHSCTSRGIVTPLLLPNVIINTWPLQGPGQCSL